MDVHDAISYCENELMNGTADEVSGDVEAPTGHFYRVDRFIVVIDGYGARELITFGSSADARGEFALHDVEFAKWELDHPSRIAA